MVKNEIEVEIEIEGLDEYKRAVDEMTEYASKLKQKLHELAQAFKETTQEQKSFSKQLSKLSSEISEQGDEISCLSMEVISVAKTYDTAKNNASDWAKTLKQTTNSVRELQEQTNSTTDGINKMNDSIDKTSSQRDSIKLPRMDIILSAVKDGAEAIFELEESTREYRKMMANLESASVAAGYSAEVTAASYEQLYGVLGDDSSTANTLTNLQNLKINQEQLPDLINAAIGAWATYGESIPIESLSEAISETVKMGEATGAFSDLLKKADISEAEFNKTLQASADGSERMNAVMKLLTEEGLVGTGAAWQEVNKDLIDVNNSTSNLNQAFARLGEEIAPAVSAGQQVIADLLNTTLDWVEENSGAIDSFLESTAVLESASVENAQVVNETYFELGEALAEAVASMMESSSSLEQAQADNVQAMNDSFAEFVSFLQSSVDTSIVSMGTLEAETASQSASIASYFAEMIPAGLQTLVSMMESAAELFSGAWEEASAAAAANAESVSSSTFDMAGEVRSNLTDLSGEASGWGLDMVSEFASGISSNQSIASRAASAVASAVRRMLHFTVPDEGPLSDADEYGPDFMKLLSKGITDNIGLVERAAETAAGAMVIQPQTVAVGNSNSTVNRFDGISINVYGAVGQDVSELADAVMDRMQMLVTQKEVAFNG